MSCRCDGRTRSRNGRTGVCLSVCPRLHRTTDRTPDPTDGRGPCRSEGAAKSRFVFGPRDRGPPPLPPAFEPPGRAESSRPMTTTTDSQRREAAPEPAALPADAAPPAAYAAPAESAAAPTVDVAPPAAARPPTIATSDVSR